MLEYTQENLITDVPTSRAPPRLSSLVTCCAQVAHECVDAVEGGIDYFDEGGLRFAIVTDPADLAGGGAISAFLGVDGDPMPEALLRMEGYQQCLAEHSHLLALSLSDTRGDF